MRPSFPLCFRRRTKSAGEESGGIFPRRQPALVRLRDGVAEEDQPIVGEGTEVRKDWKLEWSRIPKYFLTLSLYLSVR